MKSNSVKLTKEKQEKKEDGTWKEEWDIGGDGDGDEWMNQRDGGYRMNLHDLWKFWGK